MSTTIINNCGCCGVSCYEQSCSDINGYDFRGQLVCIPTTIDGKLYDRLKMGYPCCSAPTGGTYQSSITHECAQLTKADGSPWTYNDCPDGVPISTPCTSHVARHMLVTLPPMSFGIAPNTECPTCSVCNHPGGAYIVSDLYGYTRSQYQEVNCREYSEDWSDFGYPGDDAQGLLRPICRFGYYGYTYITRTGENCGSGGGCENCISPELIQNGVPTGNLIGSWIRIAIYYNSAFSRWEAELTIGNIMVRHFYYFPISCGTCTGKYACVIGPQNNQNNFKCKGVNTFTGGFEGINCADCFNCSPPLSVGELDPCVQNKKYCYGLPSSFTVEVL